jgi:hypothetical protein
MVTLSQTRTRTGQSGALFIDNKYRAQVGKQNPRCFSDALAFENYVKQCRLQGASLAWNGPFSVQITPQATK